MKKMIVVCYDLTRFCSFQCILLGNSDIKAEVRSVTQRFNIHICIVQLIMEKIKLVKSFYVVVFDTTAVESGVYTVARPSAVVGFTVFSTTLVVPMKLAY